MDNLRPLRGDLLVVADEITLELTRRLNISRTPVPLIGGRVQQLVILRLPYTQGMHLR